MWQKRIGTAIVAALALVAAAGGAQAEVARKVSAKQAATWGADKAKVWIVLWSDFQCPYCMQTAGVIEELLYDPGMKKKLGVAFKNFPLPMHPYARGAAKALILADRQGKAQEMHDILFKNTRQLDPRSIRGYAEEIGLDMSSFDAGWDDPEVGQRIKAEQDEGIGIGVRGTPSVYLGYREGEHFIIKPYTGPRSVVGFREEIEKVEKQVGTWEARQMRRLVPDPDDLRSPLEPEPVKVPKQPAVVWGALTPQVWVVLFSEFDCDACGRLTESLEGVLADRRYAEKVAIAFKNLPMPHHGATGRRAALALAAADERGKGPAMHHLMMEQAQSFTDAAIGDAAHTLGIAFSQLQAEMESAEIQARVETEIEQAGAAGAHGTPSIYFGVEKGENLEVRRYKGSRSVRALKKVIDKVLETYVAEAGG